MSRTIFLLFSVFGMVAGWTACSTPGAQEAASVAATDQAVPAVTTLPIPPGPSPVSETPLPAETLVPPSPSPAQTIAATGPVVVPIEYAANSEKDVYRPGEEVRVNFTITNKHAGRVTFFRLPPQFTIRGRYVPFAFVSQRGSETVTLENRDSYSYLLKWDQRITSGTGKFAGPGIYMVEPEPAVEVEKQGYRVHEGLPNWLAPFVIQHPEGDVEETLTLNQTATENGIPITLESIEMSALETKIVIFARPPGYVNPEDSAFSRDIWDKYYASGAYKLDDGEFTRLRDAAVRLQSAGARNSWAGLDPVGQGTKRFTMVVDGLGEVKGQWVFEVNLRR